MEFSFLKYDLNGVQFLQTKNNSDFSSPTKERPAYFAQIGELKN